MLPVLFAVALLAGGTTQLPLHLCTGDMVQLGRGYDLHASGNVRCMVGDVLLLGDEVQASGSKDRSPLRFLVSGAGRLSHTHGTMSADRITLDMNQVGRDWQIRRVLIEYACLQFTPAEPGE